MSSLPLFKASDQDDAMSEKQQQPQEAHGHDETLRQPYALGVRPGQPSQRERRSRWVLVGFVVLAILAGIHLSSPHGLTGCLHAPFRSHSSHHGHHGHHGYHHGHGHALKAKNIGGKSPSCPAQPDPIEPETKVDWTEERKKHSAELHAQAVQHATQSYDDNGEPGEDPRWEPFHDFLDWWRDAFPTAVERANIEMINSECAEQPSGCEAGVRLAVQTLGSRSGNWLGVQREGKRERNRTFPLTPSPRHPGHVRGQRARPQAPGAHVAL